MTLLVLLQNAWVRRAALGLVAVFALWQGIAYYTGQHAHNKLSKQQAAATAAHARQQAESAQARTAYQFDSVKRATWRAQYVRLDSTLSAKDHEISTTRPARVVLPVLPPLERPN